MKSNGLITEFFFWIAALILLAYAEPDSGHHLSLCPLANIGWHWCPGCGFGRSIAALLHGNLIESLEYHWFGVPGLLILFHRICSIWKKIKVSFIPKSVI